MNVLWFETPAKAGEITLGVMKSGHDQEYVDTIGA